MRYPGTTKWKLLFVVVIILFGTWWGNSVTDVHRLKEGMLFLPSQVASDAPSDGRNGGETEALGSAPTPTPSGRGGIGPAQTPVIQHQPGASARPSIDPGVVTVPPHIPMRSVITATADLPAAGESPDDIEADSGEQAGEVRDAAGGGQPALEVPAAPTVAPTRPPEEDTVPASNPTAPPAPTATQLPPTPVPPTATQPPPTPVPPTATQPPPTPVPPTATQPSVPTAVPPVTPPPVPTEVAPPPPDEPPEPPVDQEPPVEPEPPPKSKEQKPPKEKEEKPPKEKEEKPPKEKEEKPPKEKEEKPPKEKEEKPPKEKEEKPPKEKEEKPPKEKKP